MSKRALVQFQKSRHHTEITKEPQKKPHRMIHHLGIMLCKSTLTVFISLVLEVCSLYIVKGQVKVQSFLDPIIRHFCSFASSAHTRHVTSPVNCQTCYYVSVGVVVHVWMPIIGAHNVYKVQRVILNLRFRNDMVILDLSCQDLRPDKHFLLSCNGDLSSDFL